MFPPIGGGAGDPTKPAFGGKGAPKLPQPKPGKPKPFGGKGGGDDDADQNADQVPAPKR
jgi:hypothetical protein